MTLTAKLILRYTIVTACIPNIPAGYVALSIKNNNYYC